MVKRKKVARITFFEFGCGHFCLFKTTTLNSNGYPNYSDGYPNYHRNKNLQCCTCKVETLKSAWANCITHV